MKEFLPLLMPVLLIIGGVLIIVMLVKNKALADHEHVIATWKNIDVLFQKRHDTIKEQLELLGQAVKTETNTYKEVARLRSGLKDYNDLTITEKKELMDGLGHLTSIAARTTEAYPEIQTLKADGQSPYNLLVKEWNKVETDIGNMRFAYNRNAEDYNVKMYQAPFGSIYRKIRRIRNKGRVEDFPYFEAQEEAREAVKVSPDLFG